MLQIKLHTVLALLILMSSTIRALDKKNTYVFWHLVPTGETSPDMTLSIEKQLRKHFVKNNDFIMDEMKMDSLLLIPGNEKFLRCGAGIACLSEFGRKVNAENIINVGKTHMII